MDDEQISRNALVSEQMLMDDAVGEQISTEYDEPMSS